MKILMKSGIYHGLATHDENIIQQAQAFAVKEKLSRGSFEFQMLYESAATCSANWRATAGASASTFPSAASGIPTSCGG